MINKKINTFAIDLEDQDIDVSGKFYLENKKNTSPVSIPEHEPVGKFFNLNIESTPYINTEKSWEGYVLEVFEDYFIARLTDLDDPNITEVMEIKNIAITDQDDEILLKKGAVFFWAIGRIYDGRKRELVSTIKFRRLPVWTTKEIENAEKEAEEAIKTIGW